VPAPRKFSDEMRERAKRMVREARVQEPGLSIDAACKRIGPQLGILPDTLGAGASRPDIDDGLTPGTTTADSEELKRLRRASRGPARDCLGRVQVSDLKQATGCRRRMTRTTRLLQRRHLRLSLEHFRLADYGWRVALPRQLGVRHGKRRARRDRDHRHP
jgi:transposase